MRYIHGFFMSLGNFSILPCPYQPWNEKARDLMLVFLPMVGLLIGALWYLLFLLLDYLAIPIQLEAALLTIYPFLITGFIHLDGFMDTSDAILSRKPLEDKYRILKDPHAGAFSVIALGILFVLYYPAMWAALEKGGLTILALILIPVISRGCSAFCVLVFKPMGHSQYKKSDNEKPRKKLAIMVAAIMILSLVISLALESRWGITHYKSTLVLVLLIFAYSLAMTYASRDLKGVSGDLAGYALTIGETAAIVGLAIL